MEWSGAERGLNCVPPAKKKGIRSGLPLPLTYSTMDGTPGSFPPQALPEAAPRGNRSRGCSTPNRTRPPTNNDLLLGAACGPSCSPKDQQLNSFSFVFQPKTTREQTNLMPTRWPRTSDSGSGLPVRIL